MNVTKKGKKAVEEMLRDLPITDYEELKRVFGFSKDDALLLDLKCRDPHGYKMTRTEISEELGMSPSTLDRHLKAIYKRILKYADKLVFLAANAKNI